MSYGKAVRDELRVPTRELRHAIPLVYAGYKELHDAALAAGALDARTKELIALAIAVSKECDGCIAAHAHAAAQHGATPQEAAEAIGVTFLMNGGPPRSTARGPSWRSASSTTSGPAGARRPARGSRPGTSTRSASPMATSTPVERRRRMTLGSLRAGIRHQAKQVVMVNRSSAS